MTGILGKATSTWLAALAVSASLLAPRCAAADDRPVIPFSDLRILKTYSPNLAHTSLDGEAEVPAQGVRVVLSCVIRSGQLTACVPEGQSNDSRSNFVSVALKRIKALEVGSTTNQEMETEGRRALIPMMIRPTDRLSGTTVDLSKGDLVTYTSKPTTDDISRFYPERGRWRDIEGLLDIVCTVSVSLTLTCDDIRPTLTGGASPEEMELARPDFVAAARRIMALYVVSPKLSNGESSVGAGVRHRMRFVLE